MRIEDHAKLYITWAGKVDFDPTASTIQLEVDVGNMYPMTWQGAPVLSGGTWTQTARTNAMFIGSARTVVTTDVKLTVGDHTAKTLITAADGQVIASNVFGITVE